MSIQKPHIESALRTMSLTIKYQAIVQRRSSAATKRAQRSAANRLHSKKKWSSVSFAKPQLYIGEATQFIRNKG